MAEERVGLDVEAIRRRAEAPVGAPINSWLRKDIRALLAEVERLRAALERIAGYQSADVQFLRAEARKVLEGE